MWFLLGILSVAQAAGLVAYSPGGAPFPGDESEVVVVWPDGVASGTTPTVSAGQILGEPRAVSVGRVAYRWIAPLHSGQVRLAIGGNEAALVVRERPAPGLHAQDTRDAVAWSPTIDLVFSSEQPLDPEQVLVATSEGQVKEVRAAPGGLSVTVVPGPERVARILGVGILDLRTPGQVPVFATVRLRAHHGGEVKAEPGSRLSIKIGGRGYGPWVADVNGAAVVSFDALPGETTYELTVADDLGNTQRVTNPVPTLARPAFVALARANFDAPGAWLAGWEARGQAYSGEAPTCRLAGAREAARSLAKGQWSWSAPVGPADEAVAVCSLAEATATVRVHSLSAEPASVALRVYPESVSADFPLAEVQAWLLDDAGQRLPPDGLVVSAGSGRLTTMPAIDAVRADYDGSPAATSGGDELRASWRRPAGKGPAARLELCVGGEGEATVSMVRVLDAAGRPLSESPVELGSSPVGSGELRSFAALSDDRGYARFPIGPGSQKLVATSGNATGEALDLGSGDRSDDCLSGADALGADLVARFHLAISAGRVRQVSIETEPRTLRLDPGATARVRIRLLDGAGGVIRDEPVSLQSSEGSVSAPVAEADGSFTAIFVPAPSTAGRSVQIVAEAGDTKVSTTLDLIPREVRGGVSVSVGYLSSFGVVESPTGTLAIEHRLPFGGLAARIGVSAYGLDERLDDELSGETIRVRGVFFPTDAGVTFSSRGPRWSLGAGIGLVLVPYGLTAEYPGGQGAGGPGISAPGVVARGTAGYRFGQTEAFAEVGYLLFTLPDSLVGISGNAGGLTTSLGYRLLY